MRRIVIWLASTVTVVVLLFGYHTSTNSTPAASDSSSVAPATPSSSSAPSQSTSSVGSSSTPTPSSSTPGPSTPSPSATPAPKSKKYTGRVAQTRWGPVEVEVAVTDGTITKVTVVQSPSGNGRDIEINNRALPVLVHETVDAQSTQIDMVSGATVTSEGYVKSLQSALDAAGI